jgi:hypothetical protein
VKNETTDPPKKQTKKQTECHENEKKDSVMQGRDKPSF